MTSSLQNWHSQIRSTRAFTLIEILTVLALLAVVSLAVMTSLVQGIRVYERFGATLAQQENAWALEHLTRDLKNSVYSAQTPWKASDDSISFGTLQPQEGGDMFSGLPAAVGYRLDPVKKEIIRTENHFPYEPAAVKTQILARQMQSLAFEASREPENQLPSSVTVSLEYGDPRRPKMIQKQIVIPASYNGAPS